jgi:Na+/melibiose symporter-like transporter
MKSRELIGWGVGSFTSASLVGAVGLLHLRFMTDSLGLAMGLAGLLVVISRVYDSLLDPVMGALSDRTTTRWGHHRPYLLGAGLLSAVSLVLLFNVPVGLSGVGTAVFSGAVLLLYSTAYTMFRVPYLAVGRSITQDFNERSRLMTFSVCGSSLGTLAATSAAPLLLTRFGSDRAAHGEIAWLLAALVALGAIATFVLINTEGDATRQPARAKPIGGHGLGAAFRATVANRPFRNLIGFKVLMFAGLALHGAAIPFYTRHVLKAPDTIISGIFLAQTVMMMVSQPGWVRVARQFGRRQGLMAAALIEAACMVGWFFVPAGAPSPWVQVLGGIEGICVGGLMFGLYTVLTDTMDEVRAGSSAGQEGLLSGVFVMVEKATTAGGTLVFSSIMAAVGFVSATAAGSVQSGTVLAGITFAISVLPAIVAVLACLFLRRSRAPIANGARLAGALVVLLGMGMITPRTVQAKEMAPGIVVTRITAGPDGKSQVDAVTLPRAPGTDPTALVGRLYATDVEIGVAPPGTFVDWHKVSTPRLLVILKGTMEIGTGDGKLHRLGPGDFALAADLTGQGHTSRTVGTEPVMAMTVRLPTDDPLRSRESSCPDGMAADVCVANHLSVQHSNP